MATETAAPTPGLTLGPLDPDNTSEMTARLGVHNKAAKLLKAHASNWPVQLTTALSRPIDVERTEALDQDEVLSALSSLRGRRAFFDEDSDVLEDATVRGVTEKDRVVAVVFRRAPKDSKVGVEHGRSAYGVIPYAGLDASVRAYEEKKAREELGPLAGFQTTALEAQEGHLEGVVPEEQLRAAEDARRQAEQDMTELRERLERLENPEPWDGYDDENANAVVERVKEGGIDEFGRAGLERIRSYEESYSQPRKTVLAAVDEALATRPAE